MAVKNKTQLVKALLNKNGLDANENYDELLEMLIDEPIAINFDKAEKRTLGEIVADKITEIVGSWKFIIGFCIFLFAWMLVNTYLIFTVDPYPFILLNLILSCIAAVQAPIIMMSQNREAKKESIKSTNEYKTTLKSELILEDLHDTMELILKNQKEILKYINEKEKN
jgi:uncharacterized membrane protein